MKTNLKVLIADDSESFGRECQKELKEAGFDVIITAKDGSRVMSVIDAQHIDVVLIDALCPMVTLSTYSSISTAPLTKSRWSLLYPRWTHRILRSR